MAHTPIEPTADQRAGALAIRQMYLALVEQGFTEHQALVIVGQVVVAGIGQGQG